MMTINGNTIITIKKSVGSLHANDETIIIAATNITANPVEVDIAASTLRRARAKTVPPDRGLCV
jgi:hypothetical protein